MSKQITTEFITGLRDKEIADMKARMAEHEELTLALAEFEGRVLNKRLKLGRFRLENGDIYGVFRHFVSSPIKTASLKGTDSPNWQPDRVKRLEQLDINQITATFSAVEQHFNEIRRLFGKPEMQYHDNPLYYNLLRAIHEPEGSHSTINLNNFYYIRIKE